MYKKIAVVCANPWEKFLPFISQGNAKKYYEWLYDQAVLREENSYFQEQIASYGDLLTEKKDAMFLEKANVPQFLYMQTKQAEILERVLNEADLILIGMPQNREECDRIYLMFLPWLEKSIFIWNGNFRQGEEFLRKIKRDYKLKENQIVEINKLPSE